jgi:hypothetical protein
MVIRTRQAFTAIHSKMRRVTGRYINTGPARQGYKQYCFASGADCILPVLLTLDSLGVILVKLSRRA